MADELNILLGHRQSLIKAIEQYLIGEEFDPKSSGGNARSIYQYCLMYFENVECPLGSSTSELKAWVAMYTDIQRRLEEGYKEFFPNLYFLTSKQGEQDLISDVEAARHDNVARNAIVEFNQRMGKISKLLKEEGSVVDILTLLKENSNDH